MGVTYYELLAQREKGWVAFQGQVFDMNAFAPTHPGGAELILNHAGRDGTKALKQAHPGGLAFIKHQLSATEYTAALKGALEGLPPTVPFSALQSNPQWVGIAGHFFDLSAHADLARKLAATDKDQLLRDSAALKTLLALPEQQFTAALKGVIDEATIPKPKRKIGFRLPALPRISVIIVSLLSIAVIAFLWFLDRSGVDVTKLPTTSLGASMAVCFLLTWCPPSSFLKKSTKWKYGTVDEAFVSKVAAIVSDDRIFARSDPAAAQEITSHSQDMGFHMTHPPDLVVYPLTAEEVAAIVTLCNQHTVPVIARGAGSGLEGSSIPYFGGVVLDLMRMKKIELLASDSQCRVQPGLKKLELNEWLEPHGLLFGPDPASNPSIGGMASTSGSGLSTIMYGTTRENIVSLKVVTSEGKIIKTRSRVRKTSSGYDLTNLFIGSEGTLGIIVELTLRLQPIQKTRTGALVSFKDIFDSSNAVIAIVRSGAKNICRCELLNADGILATNAKYGTKLSPAPTLFLEFRGEENMCTASWKTVEAICSEHKSTYQHYTTQGKELDQLWEARRGCYIASMTYRQKEGDRVYLSDTCVPISNLAEMIAQTEKDFMDHGFPCIICAHIADGNFHCCIPYQLNEQAKVIEIEHRMISRAISMEGTVTGEHGVGIGKIALIEEEHGKDHIDLQRAIKRAWDPKNILNPGKLFILPTVPGGSWELPAIYNQTKDGATKGTYTHQ